MVTSKTCPRCKESKPLDRFWTQRHRNGRTYTSGYCKPCKLEYDKTRRSSRPDLVAAANLRRRAKNKAFSARYRKEHPSYASEQYRRRGSTADGHFAILVCQARRRAKTQNVQFDLDAGMLSSMFAAQLGRCALSGVTMTFEKGKGRVPTAASLDRILASRGYGKGNVRLVCVRVNEMRSSGSDAELISWCEAILRKMPRGGAQFGLNPKVARG